MTPNKNCIIVYVLNCNCALGPRMGKGGSIAKTVKWKMLSVDTFLQFLPSTILSVPQGLKNDGILPRCIPSCHYQSLSLGLSLPSSGSRNSQRIFVCSSISSLNVSVSFANVTMHRSCRLSATELSE